MEEHSGDGIHAISSSLSPSTERSIALWCWSRQPLTKSLRRILVPSVERCEIKLGTPAVIVRNEKATLVFAWPFTGIKSVEAGNQSSWSDSLSSLSPSSLRKASISGDNAGPGLLSSEDEALSAVNCES